MNENTKRSVTHNFTLDSFKTAKTRMISTNEAAYSGSRFNSGRKDITRVQNYSEEQIKQIIESGSIDAQRRLSRNYFLKDGFYKKIILHIAGLLNYSGLLIPSASRGNSLSSIANQKRYYNAMDYLDIMSIPEFMFQCAYKAFTDGAYFGIIVEADKKNFCIMELPGLYCTTRFKDIFGNDIIEFNLSYFDNISDETLKKEALASFPKYVQKAYAAKLKGKPIQWVKIPAESGICFPFLDGRPPFLNVIAATIAYDDAVTLERERDIEEIKKIIVQQIPHLSDGTLLFEPEEAVEIHQGTVEMMKNNPNVNVLTTYADVDAITSKTTSDAVSNTLEKSINNIYYQAGVSGQLFNSTTNSTLDASIKNEISFVMPLVYKMDRFVTNLINRNFGNGTLTFKYQTLPVTQYNQEKYVDEAYKLVGNGYSLLLPAVAMGFTQKSFMSLKELENDVLDITTKLIPPTSAYTQSGPSSKGESGAPAKEPQEKKETTLEQEKSLDKQGQGGNA